MIWRVGIEAVTLAPAAVNAAANTVTIPANALSVLRISRIVPEAGGLRIEWQGGTEARQFLERRKHLLPAADNWITIYSNPPPTPLQTNVFELTCANRTLFYRVRAVRE